ncbi:MAG: acyl-CoA dehydrogenase, partial [Mycobacterium sp.]|nr:acyl-CoA dehydrogenase [Mycobacterium sp.]
MDFSHVVLSREDAAFQAELRSFLADLVTPEVIARDRATGENFDEAVHLALGDAGYLRRDYRPAAN